MRPFVVALALISAALLNPSLPARSQDFDLPVDTPISFAAIEVSEGEEPHAYGPTVALCRLDARWLGFLSVFVGPVADPPSAPLEMLRLDEQTGTIRFTAELIIGASLESATGRWIPARRRYEFSGRIASDRLQGVLTEAPAGDATGISQGTEVSLARDTSATPLFAACEPWLASWQRRLEARAAARVP